MKKLSMKILICTLACISLGFLSGLNTIQSIKSWYIYINKPTWNPPNWLFGPVWSILYILMGIALALIWQSSNSKKNKAILLFIIQFALNLAWSAIFFGQHQIGLALIEILIMLAAILLTTFNFIKINRTAGYLMMPYILWVSFASCLNGAIWLLNR